MGWTDWAAVEGDGLDFEEILYDKKHHSELGGGVARVTINKPDKYNTMTLATVDEMFRAFYDANHDTSIGVIVVAGAGKHFGAGGDVEWEKWGLREAFYNRYPHNRLIRNSRKPVMAVVQGYCLAGHNHMAYCCDFTIAADNGQVRPGRAPRCRAPPTASSSPTSPRWWAPRRPGRCGCCAAATRPSRPSRWGSSTPSCPSTQLWNEVDQWCEELLEKSPGCLEILKASFDQEMDGYTEMGILSEPVLPPLVRHARGQGGRQRLHGEAQAALLEHPRARDRGAREARWTSTRPSRSRATEGSAAPASQGRVGHG